MPPLTSLVAGRLAAAFLSPPDGHRIAGRELRPFCVAHALALRAIDNPLPWDTGAATIPDLIAAARVCSCGSFAEIGAIDWDRITGDDAALVRGLAKKRGAVDGLRAAWGAYRTDFVVAPELVEKERRGKPCTTPFLLGLVVVVAKAFGRDPEWAWFLRYGQLLHYAAALNEGDYGCRWVTEEDERQIGAIEARIASGQRRQMPPGARVVRRSRGGGHVA
jgi:hypothetical protein